MRGRNKMNVGIDAACSQNQAFTGNGFGRGSDDHAGSDTVHHVGVAGFTDSCNQAVLNANIGLENSSGVNHESACNHGVQAFFILKGDGLAHAIAKGLATAEFCFVAVDAVIFFHFHDKGGISKTDAVANSGAVHLSVIFSRNLVHKFPPLCACEFFCRSPV